MQMTKNSLILNIHVLLAISTVLLYAVMVYLGVGLLQKEHGYRGLHKVLGGLTVLVRSLVFVTSFYI